jgi:hypothetical protein
MSFFMPSVIMDDPAILELLVESVLRASIYESSLVYNDVITVVQILRRQVYNLLEVFPEVSPTDPGCE